MKILTKSLQTISITAALLIGPSVSSAAPQESTSKLLTANFEARKIVKIEAGDFHFLPGQIAPIHTHAAPAIGYVSKGEILYQVEGGKPQLLREGEAFYEPAGPRILRFDNASATEEAIFIDFNLQQEGEPFIVFAIELTEKIDRRTLPTIEMQGQMVNEVDVYVSELEPNGAKTLEIKKETVLGYVTEGVVILKTKNEVEQRLVAGTSFSLPTSDSEATLVNASADVPAKVISFYLR